jgi:GntR family transcriptional regulator/MocR family aminotransferase
MRRIYGRRRERLLDCLGDDFAEWLDPIPSVYGMHIGAVARTALDLDQITEVLARSNVKLHSFSRYFLGPQTRTGLIFGFGSVNLEEMDRGLSALRKIMLAQGGR